MSHDPNSLLPLEALLKRVSRERNHFPERNENYFNRYVGIKRWLTDNYYRFIGAGLSTDGGIYSDHGPDHFDEVIRFAGLLVGPENLRNKGRLLNPYELYVLLLAILLHDAGNLFGRASHEKLPYSILVEMGELSGSDNTEKKAIAKVAEAHGGVSTQGDKDTIFPLEEKVSQGTASFRPRILAALLRFADEICESRTRAAATLINRDQLPTKSEAYHIYAQSIKSVEINRESKSVHLKFVIPVEYILRTWGKDDKKTYITDEIFHRLEKMNLERNYCNRFMYPVVTIERIDAIVEIVNEEFDTQEKHAIRLGDTGYPSKVVSLSKEYPDLCGKSLVKKYKRK